MHVTVVYRNRYIAACFVEIFALILCYEHCVVFACYYICCSVLFTIQLLGVFFYEQKRNKCSTLH